MFDKITNYFRRNKIESNNDSKDKGPMDDYWYYPASLLSEAGVSVTVENAIKVAAIWACNKAISETIAGLPFITYERLENGGKRRASEHSIYKLLHTSPNSIQTSQEWRECMQTNLNLYGNAYSVIERNAYGDIISLSIPIHPTQIDIEIVSIAGLKQLRYKHKTTGEIWLQDYMYHLKGISTNGINGISPIDAGRDSLGLAIAAEKFGSSFFKNGYRPSGSIEYPIPLNPKEQDNMRKSFKRQAEHGLFILDAGAKFNKLQQNAEEAQYIQTRQHQIEEVCRWYRVPPHKINHLLRSTFSNIEHQDLEWIKDTILPQVKKWEQKASIRLFDDEKYFAEMLIEGELRGDTATRTQAYKEQWYIGAMSSNEIRIAENRNPYEGGDNYYIPLNMQIANTDKQNVSIEPQKIKQNTTSISVEEQNKNIFKAKKEKEGELQIVLNDKKENMIIDNMAKDTSQRIAKAEIRELEKISGDDNKIEAFYKKHYEYIAKSIAPFGIEIEPKALTLKECSDKEYLEEHIYFTIMGKINYEN